MKAANAVLVAMLPMAWAIGGPAERPVAREVRIDRLQTAQAPRPGAPAPSAAISSPTAPSAAIASGPDTDLGKALAAGGSILREAEIKPLYFGTTHYWERPGTVGLDYVAADGRAWTRNTTNGVTSAVRPGAAAVFGNKLCFNWENTNSACANSVIVVRQGSTIRQYRGETGAFLLTITRFAPGNPENLR
jgi:hypothetical protein